MAELADALDLGSSGRPWGFKSLYPHHTGTIRTFRIVFLLYKNDRQMSTFLDICLSFEQKDYLYVENFHNSLI